MQLLIKNLGLQHYETTWNLMHQFTQDRDENTPDELWVLQHYPVYTQGQAGKSEHILNAANIPVIQTDRGGQVTYHGPGQLVIYVLLDLKRHNLGVRPLVNLLERSVVELLAEMGVKAASRCDAPGVYIDDAKICSIGLRIKRGYSYHGLAFNIDMDLTPFENINPCGYRGLKMTQLKLHCNDVCIEQIASTLVKKITTHTLSNDRSCAVK